MSSDGPKIGIVSKNPFQSQLLARFLHIETGVVCVVYPPFDKNFLSEVNENSLLLVLLDCEGYDPENFRNEFSIPMNPGNRIGPVALFNVPRDSNVEFEALSRGVRGVFFRNTEPGLFVKGVNAIINGEWWYSRDCLAKYLATERRPEISSPAETSVLTHREKQILFQLASGLSKTQISKELSISPHTVKTHIRNIYKKLGINSRFEAIRLAPKYM